MRSHSLIVSSPRYPTPLPPHRLSVPCGLPRPPGNCALLFEVTWIGLKRYGAASNEWASNEAWKPLPAGDRYGLSVVTAVGGGGALLKEGVNEAEEAEAEAEFEFAKKAVAAATAAAAAESTVSVVEEDDDEEEEEEEGCAFSFPFPVPFPFPFRGG